MIKKIIACLTICFIITGIISPVFSNASALPQPNWSDPGISEIINISDLTGWMLNGGTFDVSTYTDSESFMNDYFNSRTRTRLVSPGDVQEDYYEVLPGFGTNNQLVAGEIFARPLDTNRVIASSFREHTGYGRRLSNEVNEALLSTGHLYDTKIPLLNDVEFANFVGYNHNALNLYIDNFISSYENTNIPIEYDWLSDINDLYLVDVTDNSYRYNFFNMSNFYYQSKTYPLSLNHPSKSLSYIVSNGNFHNLDVSVGAYSETICSLSSSIIDIRINTSNGINVSYDNINYVKPEYLFSGFPNNLGFNFKLYMHYLGYDPDLNDYYNSVMVSTNDINYVDYTDSYFNSLDDALNYIYSHYCNVNIYVNDILWIKGGLPNSNLTPEFPDAIGGEELPNTTWPIYRPREPYFTSVPGVLQAIEDAIDDDGKLDIDDLKPYLTDENGDPVPDPIFDPEPIPIPVPDPVNPDIIPGLPILPAIPPDMPGFNGVSVLAEIINFTNQSLPTSLIVTFWGIVFGIVIIGLIKILHK